MSTADLHLLTGAYAMGALDPAEAEEFGAHLDSCAQCREEVAELAATATVLGIAAAETPPPGFRERVMAEVATTRQLPPVVTPLESVGRRRGRRDSRVRQWTLGAAAAVTVVALGVGTWALTLSEENSELRQRSELIAAVQTAPDSQSVSAKAGEATAAVMMSRSAGAMVFMAHGLRDPGSGRTYQIWLLGPGSSVRSVGTFDTDGGDNTTRVMKGFPDQATALAVTAEPAGGSDRPTTSPVLAVNFPSGA
ncbi:anti-sigma factor [Sporichthya polymorpha]|uniref:anti-sigma factor n=1 Tax=Sporichthya polymorpha TaxID=35751 RepID=UPI000379E43E|nr:anti-sigma factor [Sporichthya polymorpha]